MGKSETACASIGIKILLSDLVLQINEKNFNLIKQMLYEGSIEDSNGYYNEAYQNILGYGYDDNQIPETYLECKNFLIDKFKNNGSFYKSKFSNNIEPDLSQGTLFEQQLLLLFSHRLFILLGLFNLC